MSRPGLIPAYSDLPEPINRRQDDLPESLDHHRDYPEVVSSDPPYPVTNSVYATGAQDYSVKPYPGDGSTVPPEPDHGLLGPSRRRRTWIWLAVIGGVLVVLGIALGVGLALGLRGSGQSDNPAATPSASQVPDGNNNNSTNASSVSNLFDGTSLAATNYTDPEGYIHLYVFFQAANEELAVSKWDSQNETWETLSISRMLSSTGLNLDLIPASPIAAYTYLNPTFQTRVYFLTTGNSIREIITSEDPTLTSNWRQGVLGSSKLITASPGSKLAALRPQCGTGVDCRVNYPSMAMAYQGDNGVIALSRADSWEPMDIEFGPAEPGAVIGLTSVMGDNITDVHWSLFFDEDGTLQEFNSELQLSKWTRGASTGFAPKAAKDSPNIACFSYDLVNIMIVNIDPDRDLEVRTWDSRSWSDLESPNLVAAEGAPDQPRFSAVAGNSQRRIFGITDGVIHQWEFFSLNPQRWAYRGVVPTEFKS